MKSMMSNGSGRRSVRSALRSVVALGAASAMLATGMMFVAASPASATGGVTVTAVTPANGPITTGTPVTITGTNFVSPATVNFGTTPATSVNVTSLTTITADAPAGAGTVDVTVADTSGTSPANPPADYFTYGVPTISSVSPSYGPTVGGSTVTITGNGFTGGTGVTFGSNPGTSVNVISPTTITVVSPASTTGSGPVQVTVTNTNGASTSVAPFTYGTATVSGVSPSSGPTFGGTYVTIYGTNFTGATAVHFGTNVATSFSVTSNTTITAVSPPGVGTVDVTVWNTYGVSATSFVDSFTYGVPTVTSVSPSFGPTTGGTTVTITGTGFVPGSTSVAFGAYGAALVSVVSSNSATVISPAGVGTVNVTVTTPSGTSPITAADQFTYGAPVVTSISPAAGPTTGGTTVTITGNGFVAGSTVAFGAYAATLVSVTSPTTITAISPAGAGTVNVTVTTTYGTSAISVADQFTYGAPTVSAISPSTGPTTGGTTVTITGSGFVAGSTVAFGAYAGTSVNVTSPTTITAVSPAGAGTVDVTVTNTFGTSVKIVGDHFTYGAPALTAQAALSFTGTTGVLGTPLTFSSKGGSGTGAVTYSVTNPGSAKCSISGGKLVAVRAGACNVKVTKAADSTYAAASSPITMFIIKGKAKTVVSSTLKATSVEGFVMPGQTVLVVVVGSGFYNKPTVTSNEAGTSAVVTHDTGGLLVVRVSLRPHSAMGSYVFTITLANGHSCTAKYLVK